MAAKINTLPEVNHFKVSVSSEYVHILHNGYELVTTVGGWKELQKSINERLEEHGKSDECR